MYRFLIFLLVSLSSISISAQENGDIFGVHGQVVNEKNRKIPFAQIFNLKKNQSTLADSAGRFHIYASSGDTLLITALGFEKKLIEATDTSGIALFMLRFKFYDIETVNIYALRWQDFIYEFTHAKIEIDSKATRTELWLENLFSPMELAMITSGGTAGIPINYKTKKQKAREKVEYLEEELNKNKNFTNRFNRNVIARTTGIHGDELTEFIQFCNFDRDFILNSSDYRLIMAIKDKFTIFIQNKKRGNY